LSSDSDGTAECHTKTVKKNDISLGVEMLQKMKMLQKEERESEAISGRLTKKQHLQAQNGYN